MKGHVATSALFAPVTSKVSESEMVVTGMGDHVWGSNLTVIGRDPPGNVAWDQFLEDEEIRHALTPTPPLTLQAVGIRRLLCELSEGLA